jgi:hypothetical protein
VVAVSQRSLSLIEERRAQFLVAEVEVKVELEAEEAAAAAAEEEEELEDAEAEELEDVEAEEEAEEEMGEEEIEEEDYIVVDAVDAVAGSPCQRQERHHSQVHVAEHCHPIQHLLVDLLVGIRLAVLGGAVLNLAYALHPGKHLAEPGAI